MITEQLRQDILERIKQEQSLGDKTDALSYSNFDLLRKQISGRARSSKSWLTP